MAAWMYPDVYRKTWEVNVHGLFNTARAFLPLQLATRAKHDGLAIMINVSSSGALSVRAGSASYRTSKLAVLRWTEALNLEHGNDGLLAFCVNPGAIKTRMTINEPEELRNMLPHKPEIASDTIAWLAAERREWLGGRYISCPWDMEELMVGRTRLLTRTSSRCEWCFEVFAPGLRQDQRFSIFIVSSSAPSHFSLVSFDFGHAKP
ncbi:hypothetical protein LTR17_021824 [Elasticomyces elasticus]|nr:hypothetical protein LTR17_021824 [Elasticomyces elasticus]